MSKMRRIPVEESNGSLTPLAQLVVVRVENCSCAIHGGWEKKILTGLRHYKTFSFDWTCLSDLKNGLTICLFVTL